jgi:hypothetical protein
MLVQQYRHPEDVFLPLSGQGLARPRATKKRLAAISKPDQLDLPMQQNNGPIRLPTTNSRILFFCDLIRD